jgi:nucleotide-binding universal stress UspA family protein
MPLDPADPRNLGTLDDGSAELGVPETPELERVLNDARDVIEPTRIEADYVWAAGDPGRQIIDLAKDRAASLIVIGGHHEGFFARTFGMSVQDEVKKHADCEVIVVE